MQLNVCFVLFYYSRFQTCFLNTPTGSLYDNVAGVPAQVDLGLRDYFYNHLVSGGRAIELALLGVGSK